MDRIGLCATARGRTSFLSAVIVVAALAAPTQARANDFGEVLGRALLEGLVNTLDGAAPRATPGAAPTVAPAPEAPDEATPVAPTQWRKGDRVLGQWSDDLWYPARVEGHRSNGYYLVFDDGDTAVVHPEKVAPFAWRAGTPVVCRWQSGTTWYRGHVSRIEGQRLSVTYTDGDVEWTNTSLCRHDGTPPTGPTAAPRRDRFANGTRILGQHSDGHWYPGIVTASRGGMYTVHYDTGEALRHSGEQVSPLSWGVGSAVQCNWMGHGTLYDGTIISMRGTAIRVRYRDGDEENTLMGNCRSTRSGRADGN